MAYRGKVTDDVIGFKPSKPSQTDYGIEDYTKFSKKANKKQISKLKFRLDDLLDNDVFIEELLYFNHEKFIPLEYDEDYIKNYDFKKSFNLKDFSEIWETIKLKNENHIFDFGYSNIYICFGLIKYNDYLIPLFFIPVNFVEKDSVVCVFPNRDINISFNYCLTDELYNIEFPNFNGNIIDYINQIDKIEDIQFSKKAYIGNFNLNTITCCNDLNEDWSASSNKFDLFFNNKYILDSFKVIDLNNKLAAQWPELDLKLNNLNLSNAHVLIKNLLANGKTILFVSNKFQRDFIKKELYLSNLDDLILDYSMLCGNNVYNLISDEYPINNEDIEEFSKLNEELIELEECLEVLNNKYSQLKLRPRDIKQFKDKYYDKVKDIPHDFPIKNAETYKSSYINKLKKQLINLINGDNLKDIELYLPDNFFNSSEYNIFQNITNSIEDNLNVFIQLNNQVSEVYGIKHFENLSEVKYLDNLNVLNESNRFIEEQDRFELNNLLKMKSNSIVDIKSEENKLFESILVKYEIDENTIDTIENYIKYTELIDNNIFSDENLIKENLAVISEDLKILLNIKSYLFKQIDYIYEFYVMFKCFETPKELFDSKKSISSVKNLINIFNRDFNSLQKYYGNSEIDVKDINIKNYFNLWKSGLIEKEFVDYVFSYNLYNSILNSFLDDFEYIDEKHIISSYYEDKYREISLKIKEKESNQFNQSIYLKLIELNQENNVKEQKDEWALKISNGESISINNLLINYKDYIFSNKRIFMINLELIPLVFDKTFENYFDYALICFNDDDADDIYCLSPLLRTKNKLITVGKGE